MSKKEQKQEETTGSGSSGSAGPGPSVSGSWRVPRRQREESQNTAPSQQIKRQKGQDDILVQAISCFGRLSLQSAQRVRELSAAVWSTFIVPLSCIIVKPIQEAGADYNSAVQRMGKGHSLGSPHLHLYMGMLESMADSTSLAQADRDHLRAF